MIVKPPYLGVAYYPEDWPDEEMDRDIAKMKEVGINVARIAEFAWHRMEPQPGQIDFSYFHKVVDKLGAAGIGVVLGTPTATPPIWLSRLYPDVLQETMSGRRASHGGRRHCCSNNLHYNEYSLRIVEAMAKEFASDPAVIGWQIDNEIYSGGLGCCCPVCHARFQERMREKFGTIDALNEAWNLNLFSQWYSDFSEIPVPRDAWHNPHLRMEWQIFQNDSHVQFVGRQADVMKKHIRNVPIGTDTMPVLGMDYRDMTKKLDIVQFNHYNTPDNLWSVGLWYDYLRTLKPETPFWNTETATCWNGSVAITQSIKPEGFCRANSWLPIALGGEANMYWLWRTHWAGHELMHGAVLDSSGRELHTTGEVRDVAAGYKAAADFINSTKVAADLALHVSSRNWNMMESQPVVQDWKYLPTVQNTFYKPIVDAGLRPDVIDAAEDVGKYSVIFTPLMMTIEENGLPQRMEKWVKEGGTWIVGPLSDVRNADGARFRDRGYGMLEQLTGVAWQYHAPDREGRISAQWSDGTAFTGDTWYEMTDDASGDVLVRVTGGHSAIEGKSLVTCKQVGKGKVVLLGTLPSAVDMARLLSLFCKDMGMGTPEGELMVAPRKGETTKGLILVERGAKKAAYTLKDGVELVDLLTGETCTGRIEIEPYGVRILAAKG